MNKIKNITFGSGLVVVLALAVLVAVPLSTFAATYEYVNTLGNIQIVVAVDSNQALYLPTNIASHSGVMLVSGNNLIIGNSTQNNTYSYINTSGGMNTVIAFNSTQALNSPPNIGLHSGVMLLSVNR